MDRKNPILSALLIVLMFVGGMMMVTMPVQADWEPAASLTDSPTTIYPQETFNFQFILTISTISGSNSVDITSFKVLFDWEATQRQLCSSTVTIANLPASHTFSVSIAIPQSLSVGSHTADIDVIGQANGDLFDSSGSWVATYAVATRPPLSVSISGNPSTGNTPLDVSFASTVSGGTPTYTYDWTFGDGGTSTTANPSYSYATAGTYTATLTVTDDLGRTASDTFDITITAPSIMEGSSGTLLIVVIIVIVVVVIVVAVVLLKKKGKAQPPTS